MIETVHNKYCDLCRKSERDSRHSEAASISMTSYTRGTTLFKRHYEHVCDACHSQVCETINRLRLGYEAGETPATTIHGGKNAQG